MFTAAWWIAKWAGLKALGVSGIGAMIWGRGKQILGGEFGSAIALAISAIVALAIAWGAVGYVASKAVEARDNLWRAKSAEAVLKAQKAQREADERARRAAERERVTQAELEAERTRAADLERALAALKDDPVIFPRDLARELNK